MKILLANIGVSEQGGEFTTKLMAPLWKRNFDLVRKPDTEIVLRTSEWGVLGMDGLFNPAMNALNQQLVFQIAKNADKEGFDAVMVTCFGDPYLQQLRSFIDIPVIGIGEASMKMATMMGKRFGVVHVSEAVLDEGREQVAGYGLDKYFAGIVSTTETGPEQVKAMENAAGAIKAFTECGRKLIKMGAEVLIPACGLMSPSLRMAAGCEAEYPDGFTEVDGVPIVDVLGCALKYTEMIVELKNAGENWISRKGSYALPNQAMLDSGYMTLNDERIRYWDVNLF
ncbi:MAG: hypothetical protein HUJ76_05630 [Parasporobacterium sp.]|nr:hypothetical protein [Parasporobacterium sp.]